MKIQQLKYFICLAETLNFTKAAQQCYVVQTTITHQIAALETELDVQLFERDNRNVSLTPAGIVFLKSAKEIVQKTDDAISLVESAKMQYNETLQFGYLGDIIQWCLPDTLGRYRRSHPHVRPTLIQANISDLIRRLKNGQLDLVVSCHFSFMDDIDWLCSETLYDDELCAICASDHPAAEIISHWNDNRKITADIITFAGQNASDIRKRLVALGYRPGNIIEVDDHSSIINMVRAGYGITFCSSHMVAPDDKSISIIPLLGETETCSIKAYWNKYRKKKSVMDMVAALHESVAEL